MRTSVDEYLPFVTSDDGPVDEAGYTAYVDALENTSVWGGQLELQA
jgi:hypothetical protein